MEITGLRLIGYKRLILRNIHYFEIKPQNIYQLLIGTNGSGKTSVVKELSPLPAFSGDYIKGGSKLIELKDSGNFYECLSDFTSGNHHSFKKNGEELNPGGTFTVQKELVEQHFRFNGELHALLTDDERFTAMSPQRRREWIIKLSGGDLSYAMRIYNTLKGKARDMVGVVKHLNARLTHETSKLPTQDKLLEYSTVSESLKTELTIMMEAKDPSTLDSEEIISGRIHQNLQMIEELSIAILEANCYRPPLIADTYLSSLMDLDSVISDKRSELSTTDQMRTYYLTEHEKISEIVEALEKSNAEGLEDLRNRIESLKREREALNSTLKTFPLQKGSQSLLAATKAIEHDLIEIMSSMPSNSDGQFTREKRDRHHQNFETQRINKERIQIELGKLHERMDHIQNAKEENCPKCGYVWAPGVQMNETRLVKDTVDKLAEALTRTETSLEESRVYLNDIQAYMEHRRRFTRTVDSNPSLKALWDYVLDGNALNNAPKNILQYLAVWIEDLMVGIRIEGLDNDISTFEAAYLKASELGDDGHHHDHIRELHTNIEDATVKRQLLMKQIKDLSEYRKTLSEVITNSNEIFRRQTMIQNDLLMISKTVRNDMLNKCISDHLSTLSHYEQQLITAKAIRDVVDDLQKSYEDAVKDAEVYKVLTDELSPTDGLIADQLRGSIDCLVEQMNGIIDQIWTYDLKILPCGADGEELDYKFPVSIERSDPPIADVSKTSSSQIDIVNFAFKLVVMLYLELEDYPLYLDELAPSLDEQHRVNIMNFVRQLVDNKKCSQLYMISHYATAHGSFMNADVCIMDDRNLINRPKDYNHHVIMR